MTIKIKAKEKKNREMVKSERKTQLAAEPIKIGLGR